MTHEGVRLNLRPMQFKDHEVQVIIDTQGEPWWPAASVCELLGLGNVARTVARLDADEKKQIRLDVSRPGRQAVWRINQYGINRLLMTSRKPEAKAFTRWITHEVLPALRKTGRYQVTPDRFIANTERPTQVQNARDVGALLSIFGGRGYCIAWYRKSLNEITGLYPKEWRVIGRAEHFPSKIYRRGREVVRKMQPAGACAASLADELVVRGVEEGEALAIGQQSTALFQRTIEAGVRPAELDSSPLDGLGEDLRRGGNGRDA